MHRYLFRIPLTKLLYPKKDLKISIAGANRMLNSELLIMGKEDVYELWKAAPNATLIASHMEAVNHWTLSRRELADFSQEHNFSKHLLIPYDGQGYSL